MARIISLLLAIAAVVCLAYCLYFLAAERNGDAGRLIIYCLILAVCSVVVGFIKSSPRP